MSIVITLQPAFQAVREGDVFTFVAAATGATGVQWYANGATIAGAQSTSYSATSVGPTGNGVVYSAVFSNGVDMDVSTSQVPLWVVPEYEKATGLYGTGDYGGQPYKSEYVADKLHYYVLKKLWPIKSLDGDTVYEAEAEIDGSNLDAAYLQGQALLDEVFPDSSTVLIDDWERVLGLDNKTLSPSARQTAAKAQMAARGGLSRAYFIALAEGMGYSGAQILEGSSLQFVIDSSSPPATQLPAAVFSPAVTWTWYLRIPGATGTGGDALRKCDELRPAHTVVELGVPL